MALASRNGAIRWSMRRGARSREPSPDIVHVLPHVRSLGGTEKAVLDLVTSPHLAGLRQEVAFVEPSPYQPFPRELVVYAPSRALGLPVGTAVAVARRKPAVIHGWLLKGNLAAAMAKVLSPTSTLIASERNLGHTLTPVKRVVEHFVARMEDIATANSGAVRDAVGSRIPARAARIRVIPPGIPAPERPRTAIHSTAVMVGRLHEIKDHATALRAWSRVREVRPDARLTIVGDGPEKPPLVRLANLLGLTDDQVRFVGEVDPVPYLFGAELYLSTSRSEGFSRALLEALMVGIPIVATRVGGATELPEEGIHGIPPGNDEAIGKTILAVLDGGQAKDVTQSLAAMTAERYSLARCHCAYRALYREAGVS